MTVTSQPSSGGGGKEIEEYLLHLDPAQIASELISQLVN